MIDGGSRGPDDPELVDVVEHAVGVVMLHRAAEIRAAVPTGNPLRD